jgi:glycosyltransferase involved in cell wall biosynthesis
VLFAGRLSAEKGIDVLLDVWADARLRPSAPLRIAGDGPLRERIQAAAAADPDVEYLGPLDRDQMSAALSGTAVVAVPSRTPEALPTVVPEAFAHGRAVIAGRAGALPDMVDDQVGAVVTPEPGSFATAVRVCLREATARGNAARARYLDQYTVTRAMDRLLAIYGEVLD